MAYIAAQGLRNKLPNKARGVTDMQLNEYITDGIALVTLGNEAAEETSLSRKAVENYAKAEALQQMKDQGDMNIPQTYIEAAHARATTQMDAYRSATLTTGDDSPTRPKAVVSGTPW
jgi:hypothetical protein